jgi:hypothetical protein
MSGYYIAGEIGRTHEDMMVALPSESWGILQKYRSNTYWHVWSAGWSLDQKVRNRPFFMAFVFFR